MTDSTERDALKEVLDALGDLEPDARARVFWSVGTFFDIARQPSLTESLRSVRADGHDEPVPSRASLTFSDHRVLTPKEFMVEKDPKTDVDRVVALAYYLAKYREMPHFKTADISKLNTEAAQRKLANAAYSINNAYQRGYLVPGPGGTKQISAMGEQYVEALPNRESAKQVLVRFRPRRSSSRKTRKLGTSTET